MILTSPSASAVVHNIKLVVCPLGESRSSQKIIKDKHINRDNHHDKSKTRTHRYIKQPGDGESCKP